MKGEIIMCITGLDKKTLLDIAKFLEDNNIRFEVSYGYANDDYTVEILTKNIYYDYNPALKKHTFRVKQTQFSYNIFSIYNNELYQVVLW